MRINKKYGDNRRLVRVLRFVVLTLLVCWPPAKCLSQGVPLTPVTHLFDISHDFRQPSDVAVSDAGWIYVVDGVNNSIKVFDKDGSFLFAFGEPGQGGGMFNAPLGLDIDGSGKVYVADSGNHRIQVFTPKGEFLFAFNIPAKLGNLADPTDVAVSKDGSLCYIADNDNHYILVYDLLEQKMRTTIGSPGDEKFEFRYPFLLSLFRDKYLYIVDVINTRVQVISSEGKFVAFLGGGGVEKGEFFRPKGVTVDGDGRAYVSDSYMGVIQIFDNTGLFRSVIGDAQTGKVKKFKTPMGLFVDRDERLYVVEMFAEKIGVYSIDQDAN